MKRFNIYVNPKGDYEAVKKGWSWPAFFFGFIWALTKKMWLLAFLLFIIFGIFTIYGNPIFVNIDKHFLGKLITSQVIGLAYTICRGMFGNSWRVIYLESKSFEFVDCITAENPYVALREFKNNSKTEDVVKNDSIGEQNTICRSKSISGDNISFLKIGNEIAGYKILKRLGAGGMGQVYLVENIQMHKRYALKVLYPNLYQNDILINRFRVEARVMADLKHPNIVPVHNVGFDEKLKLYYLVMEYIGNADGSNNAIITLEDLMRSKSKLEEEQILNITDQLCSALNYAHCFNGDGIIHRDLKPANILIDSNGKVHITDFGLAKVIDSDYLKSIIHHSATSVMSSNASKNEFSLGNMETVNIREPIIGTYEYMSPEQQEGKEITVKSDIYSLGLIIYRMLTGKKLKGKWELPSEYGCSKYWDKIINKCIENKAEERLTAVEIIDLLNFTPSQHTKISNRSLYTENTLKNTGLQKVHKDRNRKWSFVIFTFFVLCVISINCFKAYKYYQKNDVKKYPIINYYSKDMEDMEDVKAAYIQAISFMEEGKYFKGYQLAQEILKEGCEDDIMKSNFLMVKAFYYDKSGVHKSAIVMYEKAFKLSNQPMIYINYGNSLFCYGSQIEKEKGINIVKKGINIAKINKKNNIKDNAAEKYIEYDNYCIDFGNQLLNDMEKQKNKKVIS